MENTLDSIILNNELQHRYINNIKSILMGKVDTGDNKQNLNNNAAIHPYFGESNKRNIYLTDSRFGKEFEQLDYKNFLRKNVTHNTSEEVIFFSPVKRGMISRKFNLKEKHYGIDIVAIKNESIKCIEDGTVILASWTQESGHVICVQHQDQLISLYKHNSVLFKKVGDIVKAGDILAIIGNSGELTDGPHLHFELWYDGEPIDPEESMIF